MDEKDNVMEIESRQNDTVTTLRALGLRPTCQRILLHDLLFKGAHRHVTAHDLYQEALSAGMSMSIATVYNTLNQFADYGLVRRIAISGERNYFDTDVSGHQHYYVEAEDRISDVPMKAIRIDDLPGPPEGYHITRVDVVVHLEAKPKN